MDVPADPSTPPAVPVDPERGRQAARIIARPRAYKICEGCDSIVSRRAATCPNCFGYRFETDRRKVAAQARLLGTRAKTSVTAQDLL